MSDSSWLWAVFTLIAAAAQTVRNATQRSLTASLGTVGATHVRFLFGVPFAFVFLAGVMLALGRDLPQPGLVFVPWILDGALAQIAATALMLAAMGERSFVVTIAYIKTEPVQVALFGLILLGDVVTLPMAIAILIATSGVVVMSLKPGAMTGGPARNQAEWKPVSRPDCAPTQEVRARIADKFTQSAQARLLSAKPVSTFADRARPTLLGLGAGAMFGLSATGYRGAILSLNDQSFVMAATFTLTAGLALQTIVLTFYLWLRERSVLVAIFRAWRPSLFAGFMGALASQFWFLAFALATAASVRTLALVEVLFAQAISRFFFGQPTSEREGFGIVLIVLGVALLMWVY